MNRPPLPFPRHDDLEYIRDSLESLGDLTLSELRELVALTALAAGVTAFAEATLTVYDDTRRVVMAFTAGGEDIPTETEDYREVVRQHLEKPEADDEDEEIEVTEVCGPTATR